MAIQIITGVVLAMHYTADIDQAFGSVERIMRDVPYGWLIRNVHMVLDAIASDYGFGPWRAKFQSQVSEGRIGSTKVLLMKPQTFYNETGRAAQAALKFYKLAAEDVTIFHAIG